jgi:tetratricopeptide (TPR) repeat protein
VPVGGFSARETLSYLSARLTDYPEQRHEALDLGDDLDGLPLGLAQAAAVMKLSGLGCREYREQFAERREHMSGVRVAGVSAAVLATWSLAAECAHRLEPAGLAWPALALTALLDSHGIPAVVLTSPAACSYITGRPSDAQGADQELVRAAMTNLARAGLVTLDPASPVRTVRMHRCVQTAVRAYLPAADLEPAVLAAADALVQAWPDADGEARLDRAPLVAALRACAATLRGVHDGPLWQAQAHPLLFRAGLSLTGSGLAESAISYWQAMLVTSSQRLGSGHADALMARERLAAAYESGGRTGDAIAVFASTLADAERSLGYQHPDTITARGRLAQAYAGAGRPAEAATLYEQMITAASRQLGQGHPVTLTARAQLAQAYLAAGRGAESTAVYRALLADSEQILGRDHPLTRSIRENLDHGPTYL